MFARRALAAATVAAFAVVISAGMAQAATGDLVYVDQYGQQTLTDQPDSQCAALQGQANGLIVNATDTVVLIYLQPNCDGPAQVVVPGQATSVQLPSFASAQFVGD